MKKIAAAFAAGALAACTSGVNGVTPQPAPAPRVTLSLTQQAYQTTAAMTTINGIRFASIFAGLIHITIDDAKRRTDAGEPACKDGVEQTVVYNPDGFDATIGVFYDKTCTKPLLKSYLMVFINLASSSLLLTGHATAFDTSGRKVAHALITGTSKISGSDSTTVLKGSIVTTPKGAPVVTFGLTCNLTSGSTANSCGFGAVSNLPVASQAAGVSAQFDGFVGSGPASGTVALAAYTGKFGKLTLVQGKGDAWVVDGGTAVVAQNGTFTEKVNDATFQVDVDSLVKDRRHDAKVSARLGSAGMSGTVFQTSIDRAAATFQTDVLGSGSIVYSNGKKGKIVFFIVAS